MTKRASRTTSRRVRTALERLRVRRKAARRRGVALVMVLGAITVLTVFLTELQEDTSSELSSALAERDTLRAEYYARSAINLSRLLIALEPAVNKVVGPMASLMMGGKKLPQIPVWEFTDLVLGPFNGDNYGGQSFTNAIGPADYTAAKNLGFAGGGHYEIKIVDEDSKININEAAQSTPAAEIRLGNRLNGLFAPTTYDPMFAGRDPDGQFSDRPTICGAMIDWADYDQIQFPCSPPGTTSPSSGGSEDNYYQNIGQVYLRKDAPYDSLEELRLIRGVGDDFWSTFVDPDPTDPHKRVMTVWGQGTVNVNTANAQTLLAVTCAAEPDAPLCLDPIQMEAFIMGVTLAKTFLSGAPLFQSPSDFVSAMQGKGMLGPILASLGVQPVVFKSANDVKKGVNTTSKMFSFYADGVVPGYRKVTRVRIHAVVDFRHAQNLNSGQSFGIGGITPTMVQNVNSGGTSATSAATQAMSDQAAAMADSPDAYAKVLGNDPAGLVLYWHIE